MSKGVKKHLTDQMVEPVVIRDDESDIYDTDYSQVSQHNEKTARTSKTKLKKSIGNYNDEVALRRQKLEINLSNAQLEESMSTDFHQTLQERYDKVESTLEAFIYYVDTLNLEMKACSRLCQQLNGLIATETSLAADEDLSDWTRKVSEETDSEFGFAIKKKVHALLNDKKDVGRLVEEFNNRKQDFKTASQNFKILLNATNLKMREMDKLQRQYDKILVNYQHSRCMLDSQIPEIISERVNGLINCFCDFSEDLDRIASERSDMSQLFQHFESSLKICSDLTLKRNIDTNSLNGDNKDSCNICSPRECNCNE